MKKKIYYLFESNGDLSYHIKDLATIVDLINGDLEGVPLNEVPEFLYTITPVLMTDEEFENLHESDY